MTFFTLREFIDILIMVLAVGFIFKDAFQHRFATAKKGYEPLEEYANSKNFSQKSASFFTSNFFMAILATAPAILFHELAHKITALAYGIEASFHAAYFWLAIGVLLKLLSIGFIFFVPGYVSHAAASSSLIDSIIAFAGPFLNLLLWLGALLVLKTTKLSTKWQLILQYTKSINMFLFFFNLLPLPPFDGATVFAGLFQLFFG